MGLGECSDRYVKDLSGGERKRLSIALELVDDPSILFLDEPTTGLDSLSAIQCLQLLKKLSQQGRIVVCSIHVPSWTMLELFDFLYIISKGQCVYQGSFQNVFRFLESANSRCPEDSNPIDYILEISSDSELCSNLVARTENGLNKEFRNIPSVNGKKDSGTEFKESNSLLLACNYSTQNTPSTITQIQQLLIRMCLTYFRNPGIIYLRLLIHLLIAIFIGVMYLNIGNEASEIFNIYKFLFFNIFILMFTAFSSIQTTCEFTYVYKK